MFQISRISQIATILAKHGFSSQFQSKSQEKPAAIRFKELLEELGTTFIKIGQILSTRADLLPPDFIESLSQLQSQVSPTSSESIQIQIESSLKKPIFKLFKNFDKTPLASASIAQVHRATLNTGEEVVVKVLRPGIRKQVLEDTQILIRVFHILEWFIQEAADFSVSDLAKEFKESLAQEVDFRSEAAHLKAFQANNQDRDNIELPVLYEGLSSKEVLTMGYVSGKPINLLPSDTKDSFKSELASRLIKLEFLQVFEDGLFHADPHPGNILLTPKQQIAFIDFGMMGQLTRDHQDRLLMILMALHLRDSESLARHLIYLGSSSGHIDISRFTRAIRNLLARYAGLAIGRIEAGSILSDVLSEALKFHIRLPKEFALLAKMVMTLEGIVRLLGPEINVSSELAKHSKELFIKRLDFRDFKGSGMKTALQLATLAQDLPSQFTQALMDIQRGEFRVQVSLKDAFKLEQSVHLLSFSLITSSFVLVLGAGGFIVFENHPLAAALLWISGALLALLAGAISFLRLKQPKLSLLFLKDKFSGG